MQPRAPVGVHDLLIMRQDAHVHALRAGGSLKGLHLRRVRTEGNNLLARRNAKAVDVGRDCACEHDPGAVIVGKGNGTLCSAGRDDCLLGIDPP